jgi:ERCC4-type nuclease
MRVIIDEREQDLFSKCTTITSYNSTFIELSKQVLPLGDIYIKTDGGKDVMIIERKSISDLMASIKDGRYEEQSYRLIHSSGFPPHSILYIIEGSLTQLHSLTERKIVYSALTSLNYFKGFSVVRTMNVMETAEYIIWMSEKIEKNFLKGVVPYYLRPIQYSTSSPANESEEGQEELTNTLRVPVMPANYCTVVKKVKKDNITTENIGEIFLCQIPGISSVTAIAIMKKFSTLPNLLKELEKDGACMENITTESNGKLRKISKSTIDNIKKYLHI